MRRARARLIASTVVGLVALGSVAYGDLVVTPMAASSGPIPTGSAALLLFSIRNTGTTTVTINNLLSVMTPDCGTMQAQLLAPVPTALMAGQEVQVEVTTLGYATTAAATCNFGISSTPPLGAGFQATFHPSAAPELAELQPSIMSFGTPMPSESQTLILESFVGSAFYDLAIVNDGANVFSFGGCGTPHECTQTVNTGATPFTITCTPTDMALHVAQVMGIMGADGPFGMTMLQCTGGGTSTSDGMINVGPNPLVIATDLGVTGTNTATIGVMDGSDAMIGADLTGPDANLFKIDDLRCQSPLMCDYSAQPVGLPTSLTIECTPTVPVSKSAILTVHGGGGIADSMAITVRCDPNASTPIIGFSTLAIDVGTTPVNVTSLPQTLTITNLGGGVLSAQLQIPSSEWAADACVSPACSLSSGVSQDVHLTLTPTTFGSRAVTMTVQSNDPNNLAQQIALNGSGVGGILDVTSPATFAIDFGKIPRNQTASRTVQMLDTGNAQITVMVAAPGAPFTTDVTSVPLLGNNGGGSFVASCNSPTSGVFGGMIGLTSGAFQANTTKIDVACEVVDSDVQISPTAFDFGEVRIGSSPVAMTLTLTNPTTNDIPLTHLQLDAARAGLSLDPSDTTTTLHAGGVATAVLALAPTSEVDLEGADVSIDVDGTNLSLPIHGKVVTAAAHVRPTALDLGTACTGSQITGVVALVNDGTATLNPSAPTMDQSFTTLFQSPTSYPSPLPPTFEALVGIAPASSATGPLHGNLTWAVDAPTAPFVVPVSLVVVDTGAAVSPNNLDFGELEVGVKSDMRLITLENCDTTAVALTTHGVTAAQGTTDAWQLVPPMESMLLQPHQPITVQVVFAPLHPGHYDAQFVYDTDGTMGGVELVGDGHGAPSPTSFYACSCSGPQAPARGWPIAAAVVVIVFRRRRASTWRLR